MTYMWGVDALTVSFDSLFHHTIPKHGCLVLYYFLCWELLWQNFLGTVQEMKAESLTKSELVDFLQEQTRSTPVVMRTCLNISEVRGISTHIYFPMFHSLKSVMIQQFDNSNST